MADYVSFVSLALTLATIYVLGRANQWSWVLSGSVALIIFALPFLAVLMSVAPSIPAVVYGLVVALAGMGPVIILFALAMSVSNRLKTARITEKFKEEM